MIDKRIAIIKDVITSPVKSFKEIDSRGSYYFGGAVVILVATGIATGFFSSEDLWGGLSDVPKKSGPLSILGEIVVDIILGVFYVFLVYHIGRRLGGTGEFKAIFSVLQYSSIPILAGIIIFLASVSTVPKFPSENTLLDFLPALLSFVMIVIPFFIWGIILSILAVRESHKFSGKRAFATLLLSSIVVGIAYALVDIA